jgi:hypothetical protein
MTLQVLEIPDDVVKGDQKFKYRCWFCQMKTPSYTRLNGREAGYCPFHVPYALQSFKVYAFQGMLRGNKKRKEKLNDRN